VSALELHIQPGFASNQAGGCVGRPLVPRGTMTVPLAGATQSKQTAHGNTGCSNRHTKVGEAHQTRCRQPHTPGQAGDTHTKGPAHACFLLHHHHQTHCGTCCCGPVSLSEHPAVLWALPASAAKLEPSACTAHMCVGRTHMWVCPGAKQSKLHATHTPCCTLPPPPFVQEVPS
jgi:hypothetical protein